MRVGNSVALGPHVVRVNLRRDEVVGPDGGADAANNVASETRTVLDGAAER